MRLQAPVLHQERAGGSATCTPDLIYKCNGDMHLSEGNVVHAQEVAFILLREISHLK